MWASIRLRGPNGLRMQVVVTGSTRSFFHACGQLVGARRPSLQRTSIHRFGYARGGATAHSAASSCSGHTQLQECKAWHPGKRRKLRPSRYGTSEGGLSRQQGFRTKYSYGIPRESKTSEAHHGKFRVRSGASWVLSLGAWDFIFLGFANLQVLQEQVWPQAIPKSEKSSSSMAGGRLAGHGANQSRG